MTTERLKRNLSALELLTKAAKNQRKAIIDTSTRDQMLCCVFVTVQLVCLTKISL